MSEAKAETRERGEEVNVEWEEDTLELFQQPQQRARPVLPPSDRHRERDPRRRRARIQRKQGAAPVERSCETEVGRVRRWLPTPVLLPSRGRCRAQGQSGVPTPDSRRRLLLRHSRVRWRDNVAHDSEVLNESSVAAAGRARAPCAQGLGPSEKSRPQRHRAQDRDQADDDDPNQKQLRLARRDVTRTPCSAQDGRRRCCGDRAAPYRPSPESSPLLRGVAAHDGVLPGEVGRVAYCISSSIPLENTASYKALLYFCFLPARCWVVTGVVVARGKGGRGSLARLLPLLLNKVLLLQCISCSIRPARVPARPSCSKL